MENAQNMDCKNCGIDPVATEQQLCAYCMYQKLLARHTANAARDLLDRALARFKAVR